MHAVGVIQTDPAVDPAAAMASVSDVPTYLLRASGTRGSVPPGVEVLPMVAGGRLAAARQLRGRCPRGRIVILYAEEALSTELASELQDQPDTTAARSYRAAVEVRLLGQRLATDPVVLAWDGDPTMAGSTVECRGTMTVTFADLRSAIATLDDRAGRAATESDQVAAGDFVWRPARGFARRIWKRRHSGTPGFILSVLETYEEVLTAGKIWEAKGTLRRRLMLPAGFRRRETPGSLLLLRDDVGPELERVLLMATPDDVEGGHRLDAGRGATWAVRATDTPSAMVRWYRRGGLPSRITRDTFVAGGVPRPLRELLVTHQARTHGIPVPEVLAARVDRVGVGRYRGLIATREIEGAVALDQLLISAGAHARQALLHTTARVVRLMHDRGLHHRDLNAGNVVLVPGADGFDAFILDLDRARFGEPVSRQERRRGLRRLDRSLARLRGMDAAARAIVRRVYWESR